MTASRCVDRDGLLGLNRDPIRYRVEEFELEKPV